MNATITTFRLTAEAYERSMRDVADLWERASRGPGYAPVGTMRECIGHVACFSGGCIAIERGVSQ